MQRRDQLVIGIAGPAGAGKSTLAQAIVDAHERGVPRRGDAPVGIVRRMSFADPIREMLRALGVPEGAIVGDKATKEKPCAELCGQSARWAMKTLGTEWGRKTIDGDLWVAAWLRRLAETPEPLIVVDDLRFDNEAEAIRRVGGVVVSVTRAGVRYAKDHASEQGLADPPDLTYSLHDRDGAGASFASQVMHVVDAARAFAEKRRLDNLRGAWARFATGCTGEDRDFVSRLLAIGSSYIGRHASRADDVPPLLTAEELSIVAGALDLKDERDAYDAAVARKLNAEALAAEEAVHHDPGPAEHERRRGVVVGALTDLHAPARVVSVDDGRVLQTGVVSPDDGSRG